MGKIMMIFLALLLPFAACTGTASNQAEKSEKKAEQFDSPNRLIINEGEEIELVSDSEKR